MAVNVLGWTLQNKNGNWYATKRISKKQRWISVGKDAKKAYEKIKEWHEKNGVSIEEGGKTFAEESVSERLEKLERSVEILTSQMQELLSREKQEERERVYGCFRNLKALAGSNQELKELLEKERIWEDIIEIVQINDMVKASSEKEENTTDQEEEIKEYIRETIEEGHSKKDICPAGKGSALGRWLRGESSPNKKNIDKWYQNAKALREEACK